MTKNFKSLLWGQNISNVLIVIFGQREHKGAVQWLADVEYSSVTTAEGLDALMGHAVTAEELEVQVKQEE